MTNGNALFGCGAHGSGGNALCEWFKRLWWRICKHTDISSRDRFDLECAGLIMCMRGTTSCSDAARSKAIQWRV